MGSSNEVFHWHLDSARLVQVLITSSTFFGRHHELLMPARTNDASCNRHHDSADNHVRGAEQQKVSSQR